jgi:hypothetical protein
VGAERVFVHQLAGDLIGQFNIKSARHIDGGQLGALVFGIGGQLLTLPIQVGALGVGLGTDRNIFARGHRHRARHQAGHAGDQHAAAAGISGGHAHDQTGGGDDAVIGTEDGGAQPANAVGAVVFGVFHEVARSSRALPELAEPPGLCF